MTEGATAVYIALATALAVWGTIAIYLGRVGAGSVGSSATWSACRPTLRHPRMHRHASNPTMLQRRLHLANQWVNRRHALPHWLGVTIRCAWPHG